MALSRYFQTHLLSGRAREQALETEHQRRPLLHQAHPPPQQIAHRPQLSVSSMRPVGRIPQAQQLRQEERVALAVRVLDAVVLRDFRRIGQHFRIPCRLQAVHQPIPVISGLHRQPLQPLFEGRQKLQNAPEFTRQLLLRQPLAFLVHNAPTIILLSCRSIPAIKLFITVSFSVWFCCYCSSANERQLFTLRRPSSSTPL